MTIHGANMAITLEDVENIAHLARLQLSPTEKQEALSSITNILQVIDQMQSINTTGVEPLAHAYEAAQRLRDDVVTEKDQRITLLALAPSTQRGLFLVPKVLE
jgi:aspartyl-tRNA(Asn)/glutamyl-tRNA(Gln) amidotransferase subunit C